MSKIETSEIRGTLVDIFKSLKESQQQISLYKKEMKKIDADTTISTNYAGDKRAKLDNEILAFTKNKMGSVNSSLDQLEKAVSANETVFDIENVQLQTSIQLINTAGGNLSTETTENIVKCFLGDQQALKIVKSLYEAKGLDTAEVDKCIFDISDKVNDLKGMTFSLAPNSITDVSNIVRFAKEIKKLADLLGIQLSESEIDLGLDEISYYQDVLSNVMGTNTL